MKINLSNYQAYFLDYSEGNLTPTQMAELKAFLKEHPELINELEEFESITLEPEQNTVFEFKNSLKKPNIKELAPITENNYREFFVYEIDGELSQEESAIVKTFLEINPHLQVEYKGFKQTILSPDNEIIEYPDKNSLKKTVLLSRSKYYFAWSVSIAASLLIIFGLTFIFITKNVDKSAKLADNSDINLNPSIFLSAKTVIKEDNGMKVSEKTNIYANYRRKNINNIDLLPVKSVKYIENNNFIELAYIQIPEKIQDNKIVIVANSDDLVQTEPVTGQTLINMAWHKVTGLFSKDRTNDSVTKKVDVWDFANAGVIGLNKITENEFQLLKQRNQNGELVGVKLVGKNFAISKKIRNRK